MEFVYIEGFLDNIRKPYQNLDHIIFKVNNVLENTPIDDLRLIKNTSDQLGQM